MFHFSPASLDGEDFASGFSAGNRLGETSMLYWSINQSTATGWDMGLLRALVYRHEGWLCTCYPGGSCVEGKQNVT